MPSCETTIAPIWVFFPSLPSFLFTKEAIFSLASGIGSPLKLDKATDTLNHPSRARVFLEANVNKSLLARIQIVLPNEGSMWQAMEYENHPSIAPCVSTKGM